MTKKNITVTFLTIGLITILVSGFLPFSTTIYPVDEDPGFASQLHNGFTSILWFAMTIYSISLILLAKKVNSPGAKFRFYLILILGGLLLLYIAFISSFSWGGPLHPSLKYGVNIACVGLFIVVVAAILSIPKAQQTRIGTFGSYVLPFIGLCFIILSAYLPYRESKNGIDHILFFVFVIFGSLIFLLGFRTSLFSKIATYLLVTLSIPASIFFEERFTYTFTWDYQYGFYLGLTGYLVIVASAIIILRQQATPKNTIPIEEV